MPPHAPSTNKMVQGLVLFMKEEREGVIKGRFRCCIVVQWVGSIFKNCLFISRFKINMH